MAEVNVSLGERSYTIYIGNALLSNYVENLPHKLNQQLLVITNPTISQHYLKPLLSALAGHQVEVFEMRDGEQFKSLESYSEAMDLLINAGFNRDCGIIALGGGVVGDLAGFVASTFPKFRPPYCRRLILPWAEKQRLTIRRGKT